MAQHFNLAAERSDIDKARIRRNRMLISFSTLVLASQLIVTVADNVPNFNIERKCKAANVSAFDPSASLNARIKGCVDDEQAAKDQLQTQWAKFAPSDKKMCWD
jgi:hypothetical protein